MEASGNKMLPSVGVVGRAIWWKESGQKFSPIGTLRMICDQNETVLDAL